MSAARLVVRAKSGARVAGIALAGDVVVVSVREKAVDGEANAAVLRAVAVWLDLPVSALALVRGVSARVKQLAVSGVSEAFVADAVAALSRGPSTSSG